LVSVLFKNRSNFLKGNRVDILKVLKVLKANHILSLRFKETRTLELSFATTGKRPLFFVKMMRDVLNSMGYNHTLTTKAVNDTSGFLWKISIKSAGMIDPLVMAEELDKRGGYLTSIKRYSPTNWRYNVDLHRAHLKVKTIPKNEMVSLKKPLDDYWIAVSGSSFLRIESRQGNIWHPYIVFYDKNLQILDNYTKERKSYNASLKIPRGSAYVKISDLYTLENIKRGLNIRISQRK